MLKAGVEHTGGKADPLFPAALVQVLDEEAMESDIDIRHSAKTGPGTGRGMKWHDRPLSFDVVPGGLAGDGGRRCHCSAAESSFPVPGGGSHGIDDVTRRLRVNSHIINV